MATMVRWIDGWHDAGCETWFLNFSKIIINAPLLAAEGFLILRIQIQGARTVVFPSSYDQIADQTGEFACPSGGYGLTRRGNSPDRLGLS